MTVKHKPYFPQGTRAYTLTIDNAQGTTPLLMWAGSLNGSKITNVLCYNHSNVDYAIHVYLEEFQVNYLLTTVNIPANSGTNISTPPISLFNTNNLEVPVGGVENKAYLLANPQLQTYYVSAVTTLSGSDTISIKTIGEDY